MGYPEVTPEVPPTKRSRGAVSAWKSWGRAVKAAWWVKNSLYSPQELKDSAALSSPHAEPLRIQLHPYIRGPCGQSANSKSCKVPPWVVHTLPKVQRGLQALAATIAELRSEMEGYCFGNVGMTAEMQDIQDAMVSAWDFSTIAQHRLPREQDIRAFDRVYKHLRPDLLGTQWPIKDYKMQPDLRQWPAVGLYLAPCGDLMHRMYKIWWAKVHRALAPAPSEWVHVSAYVVQPFGRTDAELMRLLRARLAQFGRPQRNVLYKVAAVVSSFIRPSWNRTPGVPRALVYQLCRKLCTKELTRRGTILLSSDIPWVASRICDFLGLGSDGSFMAQASELEPVCATAKRSRAVRSSPLPEDTYAALRSSTRLGGRIVYIRRRIERLDARKIAAAIEQNAHYSKGCWHISRLFHRCRRVLGTESPCESWISTTKYLFATNQTSPATLARRLRIAANGVRGTGCDDVFVDRIARGLTTPEHMAGKPGEGRKRSRQPKDGVSAGLRHLREREQERLKEGAVPLAYMPSYAAIREKRQPVCAVGLGRAVHLQISADRHSYQPATLEKGDKEFLQKIRRLPIAGERNPEYCLPLYAATKAQWDTDLLHDTTRHERAQTWITDHQDLRSPRAQPPAQKMIVWSFQQCVCVCVACVCFTAGVSSPRQKTKNRCAALLAHTLKHKHKDSVLFRVLVVRRKDRQSRRYKETPKRNVLRSSSSSASSSGSSSTNDEGCASAAAKKPRVIPRECWLILKKGGTRSVIHRWVTSDGAPLISPPHDMATAEVRRACKVDHLLSLDAIESGMGIKAAEATGRTWCPGCLKKLPLD